MVMSTVTLAPISRANVRLLSTAESDSAVPSIGMRMCLNI